MNINEEEGVMLAALKMAVVKPPANRNYEDLLVIKSYISKAEFFREIFSNLSLVQVDELCRSFRYESYSKDFVIFKQHAKGEKFYLIIEGSCSISILMKQDDGSYVNTEVHVAEAGGYFGERALQFDEPRAATVITREITECLSLSKEIYTDIIKNANAEVLDNPNDKSAKSYSVRVLSKRRDMRTQEELLAVASYLDRRVDFFRKFTRAQQIELARVSELLVVKPNVILFKQGQIGQGFYIILSGTVNMFVDSPHEEGQSILVNTAGRGGSFGERALESSSSARTATVSIGEQAELLLITKDDYSTIVADMKAREKAEKIELLKNSHCFQNLSNKGIEELTKYMEPRSYTLDKLVYKSRTKAMEMIVVAKGEMLIEVELEETDGTKHDVVLGRVGPSTVLADYITQCTSFIQDMVYKEKVTSMSLSSVYVVNKYDIFFHLSLDTRFELSRLVLDSYLKPPATSLFDNVVQKFGEKDWRIHKSWKIFKNEVPNNLGYQILDTHKTVAKDLPLEKGSSGNLPILPKAVRNDDVLTVSKFHADHTSKKDRCEKHATSKVKKGITSNLMSSAAINVSIEDNKESSNVRGSVLTQELSPPSTYVFSLVQFHQEKIKLKPKHLPTKPEMAKMYIQFCGVMHSSEDAQNAANTHMLNMKIIHQKFEHQKLQWRPYVDFLSIPIQHSDHFVVYCRSAPVAVASYSPNVNMLELDYPEPCKPKAQRFTCALFRSIERADLVLSDVTDDSKDLSLVKELQSFVEIQSVYSSLVDCFRDAKTNVVNNLKQRLDGNDVTACVFPLFHWLLLSDETFEKFDCRKFTEEGQHEAARATAAAHSSIGDMYEFTKTNSHLVFSSIKRPNLFDQSVTETFTNAGVNENAHKIEFKQNASDALITPTLTLRMLDEEVSRKEMVSEVMRRRQATAAEAFSPNYSSSGPGINVNAPETVSPLRNRSSRARTKMTNGDRAGGGGGGGSNLTQSSTDTFASELDDEFDERKKVPTETIEQRLASIYNMIEARQRVIDQNDNLCVLEKFVKNRSKQLKEKQERMTKMGSSTSASDLISSQRLTITPNSKAGSANQNTSQNHQQDDGKDVNDLNNDYGIDVPKEIKYAVQQASHNRSDPYIMQRAMSKQQYDMNLSLQTVVADVQEAKKSHVKGSFQGSKQKSKKGSFGSSVSSSGSFPGFNSGSYADDMHSSASGNRKTNTAHKSSKVPLSTKLEVLEELLQNSVKGDTQ